MSTDIVRSCVTKMRYATEGIARSVADRRERAAGVALRVYLCDDGCGGFHITKRHVARFEPKAGWRPARISARDQAALERRRPNRRFR